MRHRKDDGTVVSLTEVVNNSDEQVNYTSTKKQQKLNDERQLKKEQLCGYCGRKEIHNKQTCPAGRPGVYSRNCYETSHFTIVCRSPKDRFKRQWMAKTQRDRQVNSQINALDNSSDIEKEEQLNYHALSLESQYELVHDPSRKKSPNKLFTSLSLSKEGNEFKKVPFQVDTAATCNTMPFDMYKKFGGVSDLKPTKSTLFSYCGHSIKPLGIATLLCEAPTKFESITFQVVDNKDIQGKPALLGVSDSVKLGLIKYGKVRVHMSSSNEPTVVADKVNNLAEKENDRVVPCNKDGFSEDKFLKGYSEVLLVWEIWESQYHL